MPTSLHLRRGIFVTRSIPISVGRRGLRHDGDRTRTIDLAVIATSTWDQRAEMQDTVRSRLGNDCDVLAFTAARFRRLSASGEPVVADILRDGVALIGSMPRVRRGVA